jgi:hypothetical protein
MVTMRTQTSNRKTPLVPTAVGPPADISASTFVSAPTPPTSGACPVPNADCKSPPAAAPPNPTATVDLTALSESIARQLRSRQSISAGLAAMTTTTAKTVDRRKSYRCPASGPHSKATLKLQGQRFEAEILDESADGLSLLIAGEVACEVGQTALMKVGSSWAEIRVMNIRYEPRRGSESGERAEPRTRLGVLRVKDVEEPLDEIGQDDSVSWTEVKSLFEPFMPLFKPAVGVLGLLAAVLVFALTLDRLLDNPSAVNDKTTAALHSRGPGLGRLDAPQASESVDAPPPLEGSTRERSRPPKPKVAHAPRAAQPAAPPTPSGPLESPRAAEPLATTPPQPARPASAERPSALLQPKALERLSLSPDQRQRWHAILDEAGEAADQAIVARLKATSSSPPVTRAEYAAERALELLSDEQRQVMDNLLGEPEFARGADPGDPAAAPAEGR